MERRKLMKKAFALLVAVIMLIPFCLSSCGSEKDEPLTGTWIGDYDVGSAFPEFFILTFYDNGRCDLGRFGEDLEWIYDEIEYTFDENNLEIFYIETGDHKIWGFGENPISGKTLTINYSPGETNYTMRKHDGFNQKPKTKLTEKYIKDSVRSELEPYSDDRVVKDYLEHIDDYEVEIDTAHVESETFGKMYVATVRYTAPGTRLNHVMYRKEMKLVWIPCSDTWGLVYVKQKKVE